MSYRWRRSYGDEECGAVRDCRIPRGEPLCEQWVRCEPDCPGQRPLKRCATHAAIPVPSELPPLEEREALQVSVPAERDVYRHPRPRKPANPGDLPFDAKAARLGKDAE